jgi:hypothetical protein
MATHPSGQQEDISGFHTAAEATEWFTSDACAAWLRARGYPPDAFPAHPQNEWLLIALAAHTATSI